MSLLPTAQETGTPPRERRWLRNLTFVVFALFAAVALRYQIKLLNYVEWGDESETIVAAKMIAAGSKLYSQIFNHHGPLTFLPGLIVEQFGSFGIIGHRVPIALLQLGALFSIYKSPLIQSRLIGLFYAAACASIILLYLPDIFGNTYIYQVIAGYVALIILVQYVLPTIICPQHVGKKRIIISNVLIASLPFLSITYAPVGLFLLFATIRSKYFYLSAASLFFGGIVNIAYLAYIGSIPGYIAYHIYLNGSILPNYMDIYNGLPAGIQLFINSYVLATININQFVLFLILVAATARAAGFEKGLPWRSVLTALAVLFLSMRGGGFHGLPYVISLLALPTVFFYQRQPLSWQGQIVGLCLVLTCFVKISLLVPSDEAKINSGKITRETEFSLLAKALTSKNDKIISYSFQNIQYILSDRIPASGNYFYFPWQEKYNENPVFGIKIDACRDIAEVRPKIMYIDKATVWDRFPWDSYAGCIQSIMDKDYVKLTDRPYYIRKDIALESGIDADQRPASRQPSAELTQASPIQLLMRQPKDGANKQLVRIGVMFATYVRVNEGEAVLRLTAEDGRTYGGQFDLADLADNRYRYFDVDPNTYLDGTISAVSGGGVSLWESHIEGGGTFTCLTYEYADGTRWFTPGCPLV